MDASADNIAPVEETTETPSEEAKNHPIINVPIQIQVTSVPFDDSNDAKIIPENGCEPMTPRPWNGNCSQRLLWDFSKHYNHGAGFTACPRHSTIKDVIGDFVMVLGIGYVYKLIEYLKQELNQEGNEDIVPETMLQDIFKVGKLLWLKDVEEFEVNFAEELTSGMV